MNKDKLPVVILAVGGFALFIAVFAGSIWYMSNWAHHEVRTTLTSPGRDPGVSVRPAPPGSSQRPAPGRPIGDPRRPRIAVVIDDWGYDWVAADAFLAFPERLTVAVLPFLPNSKIHAEQALVMGHEVILHMPMEPENRAIDIGPGGVRTSMVDEDIADAVATALAYIPGASGLNNHMGSLATGDPRVMRAVLGVVAEQGLFFLDSFTAPSTVGPDVARALAVPHAVNQVFLDHIDTEEHVRGQIARLVKLAEERGYAVGIGHVRPNTYNALIGMLPELRQAGIQFVPISELLTRPVLGEAGGAEPVTPGANGPRRPGDTDAGIVPDTPAPDRIRPLLPEGAF